MPGAQQEPCTSLSAFCDRAQGAGRRARGGGGWRRGLAEGSRCAPWVGEDSSRTEAADRGEVGGFEGGRGWRCDRREKT